MPAGERRNDFTGPRVRERRPLEVTSEPDIRWISKRTRHNTITMAQHFHSIQFFPDEISFHFQVEYSANRLKYETRQYQKKNIQRIWTMKAVFVFLKKKKNSHTHIVEDWTEWWKRKKHINEGKRSTGCRTSCPYHEPARSQINSEGRRDRKRAQNHMYVYRRVWVTDHTERERVMLYRYCYNTDAPMRGVKGRRERWNTWVKAHPPPAHELYRSLTLKFKETDNSFPFRMQRFSGTRAKRRK